MIPLTVIGGFLGAGKTTLVNRLLATAERRWGVLVNDFGALNVDAALIEAQAGATVALTNGCVCCSAGEDFGAALHELAAMGPEHILIEASGVGEPWRIAQLALIEPGFSLEPIVVMADATAFARGLSDPWIADTLERQVRHGELIVLNKIDIASEGELAAARAALDRISPGAQRIACANAEISADRLSFPVPARGPAARRFASEPAFHAWLWSPPGPLAPEAFRALLARLPPRLIRMKGAVEIAGARTLVQYASGQWSLGPAPARLELGLVLIGTGDTSDLAGELAACLAA